MAYCEGGRLEGQRGRAAAYDKDGKKIKDFKSISGDVRHQRNFIEAVRAGDRTLLNADVAVGNDSTGWCNLANVAFQAGEAFDPEVAGSIELETWSDLMKDMQQHLAAHDLKLTSEGIAMSPMLELDLASESFVGEGSEKANRFLKRQYRKGYEVPEIV